MCFCSGKNVDTPMKPPAEKKIKMSDNSSSSDSEEPNTSPPSPTASDIEQKIGVVQLMAASLNSDETKREQILEYFRRNIKVAMILSKGLEMLAQSFVKLQSNFEGLSNQQLVKFACTKCKLHCMGGTQSHTSKCRLCPIHCMKNSSEYRKPKRTKRDKTDDLLSRTLRRGPTSVLTQ